MYNVLGDFGTNFSEIVKAKLLIYCSVYISNLTCGHKGKLPKIKIVDTSRNELPPKTVWTLT